MSQTTFPTEKAVAGAKGSRRIDAIDLARGVALVAMASYHFTFDLELFGVLAGGTASNGFWKLYAMTIATTFLLLVGVGIVLGHEGGKWSATKWVAWAKRLAMIAACALIITITTYIQNPQLFVFFGILHEIAFASVAGLLFLPFAWWACAICSALVYLAANLIETPLLDAPVFWWTGLQQVVPSSVDYVPVFPWFGAVLAGMALTKLGRNTGFWERLRPVHFNGGISKLLILCGRHSLLFYMVHQPLIFGSMYVIFKLTGRI